ncbi:MAG: glycosyltransferase [Bacteroidales bacterium]|nr:glycosyltransferase [Bacteroidales bacterium]
MEIREIIDVTNLQQWIILAFFSVAFLIQLRYYLLIYLKLPLHKPAQTPSSDTGISVIICAKNEEKNLERFLPKILEQDHPNFEVVVVNDSSTDDTEELLIRLSGLYKQLRYTSIPANDKLMRGKKLALTIGLKSAIFDHVVLTDADCYPASNQWLNRMASNLRGEKRIVLGYGGYDRHKGVLNHIIRYETVFTAIQYLSFAIKGRPYMGVGRNLAYHKSLFFENKGFARHYHLLSGDDDLFVNENATGKNAAVEVSHESHTLSVPETTFRGWIKQKRRHISAGSHYRRSSRIRLAVEWISRILLYSTLICLCISSPWGWPVAALFGVLVVTRLAVFKLGMRCLDEKHLLLPSLLLDPVMPLIMSVIWLTSLFETKYQPWS